MLCLVSVMFAEKYLTTKGKCCVELFDIEVKFVRICPVSCVCNVCGKIFDYERQVKASTKLCCRVNCN